MNSQSVAGLLGAIVASIVMVVAIAYGPIGQFGKPRQAGELPATARRFSRFLRRQPRAGR